MLFTFVWFILTVGYWIYLFFFCGSPDALIDLGIMMIVTFVITTIHTIWKRWRKSYILH